MEHNIGTAKRALIIIYIDLKTRYGLGRKLEVRIDVGWSGTPMFSMSGYIWLVRSV